MTPCGVALSLRNMARTTPSDSKKPTSRVGFLHQRPGQTAPQPTHLRALRNARIHGLASPQASGCQLIVTVRCTRSVCGISTVKRPSGVVTYVMPCGEPFGLNG